MYTLILYISLSIAVQGNNGPVVVEGFITEEACAEFAKNYQRKANNIKVVNATCVKKVVK